MCICKDKLVSNRPKLRYKKCEKTVSIFFHQNSMPLAQILFYNSLSAYLVKWIVKYSVGKFATIYL